MKSRAVLVEMEVGPRALPVCSNGGSWGPFDLHLEITGTNQYVSAMIESL